MKHEGNSEKPQALEFLWREACSKPEFLGRLLSSYDLCQPACGLRKSVQGGTTRAKALGRGLCGRWEQAGK